MIGFRFAAGKKSEMVGSGDEVGIASESIDDLEPAVCGGVKLSVLRFRRSQLRLLTSSVVYGVKCALGPEFSGENAGRSGGNDLARPDGGEGAPPSVLRAQTSARTAYLRPHRRLAALMSAAINPNCEASTAVSWRVWRSICTLILAWRPLEGRLQDDSHPRLYARGFHSRGSAPRRRRLSRARERLDDAGGRSRPVRRPGLVKSENCWIFEMRS